MKDYLMCFGENGKPKFVDKNDKASFEKLLSFMKNKGVEKFVMSIGDYKGGITTKNQIELWNFLKSFISAETGNEKETIEQTINNSGKEVQDMNNEEFNNLLNNAFLVCDEFFNIKLTISKSGRIEQIKEN